MTGNYRATSSAATGSRADSTVTRRAPRGPLIGLAITATLAILVYATGWSGAFLFDDAPAFTQNPLVQIDGRDYDQWRVAAQSGNAGPLGRPIAMLSFAGNHAASGGFDVAIMKATNTLLHGLIGVLVFLLARQLFVAPALVGSGTVKGELRGIGLHPNPETLALLAAAFWLLHPLHVSTVLYSVQRMAQLSTLFTLGGLLLFVHYRARWARAGASAQDIAAVALWVLLFTLLGAYSKENGILLPWLILVCEVTLYRGHWNGSMSKTLRRLAWIGLMAPLALVFAFTILQGDWLQQSYAARDFTLQERLLSQARILWSYLGLLLWPQPHAMGFQHDDFLLSRGWLEPLTTLPAVLAWGAAIVAAAVCWRRWPLLGFAVLFYLVAHSLESSIVPLEMFYEHRNYLPSLAVCMLLACALLHLLQRVSRPLGIALLALPALLLLVATGARVHTWSDDLRLAQVNAARHPASARSQYFLANGLLRRYRAREQLGLSDEEASTSVALARHHFELMYQNDRADVSALVMLHYVDSLFYRDSEIRRDWLRELLRLLDGRPLGASANNALVLLAECLGERSCVGGEEALDELTARIQSYYDNPSLAAFLHLRYLTTAEAPLAQQQAAVAAYFAIPGADSLMLAQSANNSLALQDRTAFYRDLSQWFAADKPRKYLQTQRALLNAASQ